MTTGDQVADEAHLGGRRGVGSAFAATITTSGATILLGLVSGVLTARFLGADGRGVVAAVATWTLALTWASNLSFANAMVYLQSKGADSGRVLGTTVLVLPVLGVLAVGVAQILVPVGFSAQTPETRTIARVFLCAVPIVLTTEAMWAVLMARHRFVFLGVVRVAQPAAYVLALVALLVLDHFTPVTVLSAQVGSYALALGLALTGLVSQGIARPSRLLARRAFGYGLRMQGVNLAALRLDAVILPAFVGATQIGYYSVAVNVSSMVFVLFGSVAMVIFPVTAGGAVIGQWALERGLRVILIGGSLTGVGLGVVAPWLIPFVYGDEFRASVLPLCLLLPGIVLYSVTSAFSATLQGLGVPGRASLVQLAGTAVLLLGLLIVVPRYGILGAATMSTVGYGVMFLVSYRLVVRRMSFSLRTALSPAVIRGDLQWLGSRLRTGSGRTG